MIKRTQVQRSLVMCSKNIDSKCESWDFPTSRIQRENSFPFLSIGIHPVTNILIFIRTSSYLCVYILVCTIWKIKS